MSKKITANGKIIDGVLKIRNRAIFDNDLTTLKGEVQVTIEPLSRKRTSPQNRYYWGVCIPLCRQGFTDLGHELNEEDTHSFLKAKFNPIDLTFEETGENFRFGGSTTEMDTIDFNLYIEAIQRFASEYLNVFIPDPVSTI